MHFRHKFLQKPPPTFSMVHLLHRLYGVDAPECPGGMPVPLEDSNRSVEVA